MNQEELLSGIAALKAEVETLASEGFAHNILVQLLCTHIRALGPEYRAILSQVFDEAADFAERVSIEKGPDAAHLPEVLKILEEMRLAYLGATAPKNLV